MARAPYRPKWGEDVWGNEVVLVYPVRREQPGGVECEHCGDRITPGQGAYRDIWLSARGNWYVHATPGECIEFREVFED